jgi:DNA-directed RNA polymerase specialized sigma24 family protein
MGNPSVPNPGRKPDWVLTQSAFLQFLDWLDGGSDSGGHRYVEMRRRLVFYFDRKNCPSPDELADETLNRVTRRLKEEGTIISDTPAHYCYIVARFVFLESLRQSRRQGAFDERMGAIPDSTEEQREAQRRSDCLERCMRNLKSQDHILITNYYQGEQRTKIENRRAMATRLGITMNALSIRASRIRDRLETCVRKCLTEGG